MASSPPSPSFAPGRDRTALTLTFALIRGRSVAHLTLTCSRPAKRIAHAPVLADVARDALTTSL